MARLPAEGRTLGRFRLEKRLGRGGMGVVFLAHDSRMDIRVALKILSPALAAGDALQRFRREVLLARRVTHPGVCRLFDLHQEEGLVFVSMEYIQGPTLESLLEAEGMLPVSRAGRIVASACRALGAAHQAGVIHRDLKAGNIIVRAGDQASLLDFGLARAVDTRGITAAGTVIGTLHTMAPEVLSGGDATPRSDLYALGVVLYRCLTGRPPFPGRDLAGLEEAIRAGKAIPARMFNPEVPAALETFLQRAMAVDPDGRFPDAAHFGRELASALDAVPDEGPGSSAYDSSGPWHGDIERSVREVVAEPGFDQLSRLGLRDTTVLFTDMVGITAYFDRHGDLAGHAKIQTHNRLLMPVITAHRGKVIKTVGDAIMAVFDHPDDGVEAAIAMQRALQEHNAGLDDDQQSIVIRIGLHSGRSIVENRDVFGNTVNVAARITSKAEGGRILISSGTRELLNRVRDKTRHQGVTRLKGKSDVFNLYRVEWAPAGGARRRRPGRRARDREGPTWVNGSPPAGPGDTPFPTEPPTLVDEDKNE